MRNVKMKIPFFGTQRPDAGAVISAMERRRALAAKLADEVSTAQREMRAIIARLQKGEHIEEARLAQVLDRTKAVRRLTLSEIPE